MAQEHLLSSLFRLQRTRLLSPLLAISATPQRHALEEVAFSVVAVDSVVVRVLLEDEDSSRELARDVVANRADTTTTILVVAVVELEVGADSDGKTTTSHSATAMLRSILSLTGRCLRRLTSIALLS